MIQAVKVLIIELGFSEENSEEDLQYNLLTWEGFWYYGELCVTGIRNNGVFKCQVYASESHGPKYVLLWWKRQCQEFLRLSQLTRYVLCIPASSAPSERAFSICGRILEQRRINLKPSSVNDILFLHGLK